MDTFTKAHVVLSLIGIVTGLVVLCGLLSSNRMNGWTMIFLITTVATSVTGFFFPFHGVTPAIILGILSLIVLTAAIAAGYTFQLVGSWRFISMSLCWWCRLSECTGPARARAQRVRATLRHRARYRATALHRGGHQVGETVSPR